MSAIYDMLPNFPRPVAELLSASLKEAIQEMEREVSLPELSSRALWMIEESTDLVHAIRCLHRDALDADAVVLYSLGLSVPHAIGWAQGCVGSFAHPSDPRSPSEVALRLAGQWHDAQGRRDPHEADLVADADWLAAELGNGHPAGWLCRAIARTGLPQDLPAIDRQLSIRLSVMSAVGLAAAHADEGVHGDYAARLRLSVELGPALLGACT